MSDDDKAPASEPHRCEDTEALKDALETLGYAVDDARKDCEASKARLAALEDVQGRVRAAVISTRERVRKWGLP
jgi:hypothetical protein